MRPKRRLYKLWKFFERPSNVYKYLKEVQLLEDNDALILTKKFSDQYSELKSFHFKNFDLRFNQLIANKLHYFSGMQFYMEDNEVLIALGCKPEEVTMWGANYDKNMKKLKNTKWKYLYELTVEHIKSIVEGNYTKNHLILEYFNKRIDERN